MCAYGLHKPLLSLVSEVIKSAFEEEGGQTKELLDKRPDECDNDDVFSGAYLSTCSLEGRQTFPNPRGSDYLTVAPVYITLSRGLQPGTVGSETSNEDASRQGDD